MRGRLIHESEFATQTHQSGAEEPIGERFADFLTVFSVRVNRQTGVLI